MVTCEGCGYEYEQEEMAVLPILVSLKDGSRRDVHLCGDVCADFWDDTAPGDWVELHSGEEVQQFYWRCGVCDGVYEFDAVKLLVDIDDYDPDSPVGGDIPQAEYIVCKSCQKKEKDRFKSKAELGL
jgi:hypothetical protein